MGSFGWCMVIGGVYFEFLFQASLKSKIRERGRGGGCISKTIVDEHDFVVDVFFIFPLCFYRIKYK